MAPQRDRKRKELVAQSNKEVADEIVKNKERTRLNSEEALAKTQEALRGAQAKVKQERQARVKAEKALAKAQEALAAAGQEPQAQIRRVSFIIRLALDEHGQIGRTEIEHVSSSKKQNFLSIDGAHLIAFMKECISSMAISEPSIPAAPSTENVKDSMQRLLSPKSNLMIPELQVLHLGDPDHMTSVLTPEEPFSIKARFLLQGADAHLLTTHGSSFELKLYANEVTTGRSKLLITYRAKLIQDVLEYTAHLEVPGLPPGLHRLFTMVTLNAPNRIGGFDDKIIIHVTQDG